MPELLEGIRVVDWTQWQMGPMATAMLADLGATVIHVERRTFGDSGRAQVNLAGLSMDLGHGRNAYFEGNNRGKKSITLDLAKEKGKEVIYRLVKNSDVFVHNFRQGVPERLGLDYDKLCQYNPKLIYAALSGYGPRGPDAKEPALDIVGQARSGIGAVLGDPGQPRLLLQGGIADEVGAIIASHGILAALLARERLGIGQKIDVSHLGSLIALQGLAIRMRLYLGQEISGVETREKSFNPIWNYYKCKDGKWLALGHNQPDRYWPFVCKALGIKHLEMDPRFENVARREENCEELVSILDEIFMTKPRSEWLTVLRQADNVIYAPIQSPSDLINDPQVLANDYIVDCNHQVLGPVKVVGIPVQFSKTPGVVKCEAPEFGQHTEEVLMEVGGYTLEEITRLREEEVI